MMTPVAPAKKYIILDAGINKGTLIYRIECSEDVADFIRTNPKSEWSVTNATIYTSNHNRHEFYVTEKLMAFITLKWPVA